MRYTSNTNFSMRSNIIALVFISLLVISFMAWIGVWLLEYFGFSLFPVHNIVWFMVISAFIGSVVTVFLQRWIFKPINKLGAAMEQVAKGNFDAQLELGKNFSEIEDIYRNFNQMAKELNSTEILKTDFISNVSHEFKTPINAIEGYATLVQGDSELDPQQRNLYAEKILFNTGRLSALVGNILLLSKVDNQSIAAESGIFRLDEQIRQAILQQESQWTQKELELDVELESVSYEGPESLMFHVWSNLIGNAVKFSPFGGRMEIRLKREGDKLVFTVSDEGGGVSDEAANRIFDKFYQADSSHRQEGNGLGLALVKQICNIIDAHVSFENIPGGCKFRVEM